MSTTSFRDSCQFDRSGTEGEDAPREKSPLGMCEQDRKLWPLGVEGVEEVEMREQ